MPIGIIFILLQIAICVWIVWLTLKRLIGAGSKPLWLAFIALVVAGLCMGVGMANLEYPVGSKFRFCGFPMPGAFFHMEDGSWVDFITPPPILFGGYAANVLAGVALAELPLLCFLRRRARRHSSA